MPIGRNATALLPVTTVGRESGAPTKSQSRRLVLLATASLALVVAAAIGLIVTLGASSGDSDRSADRAGSAARPVSSGAASGPTSASASTAGGLSGTTLTWVRRSLPAGASVLAGESLTRQLVAAGLDPVAPQAARDSPVSFVISTPALRDTATRTNAVMRVLDRSVPVARFAGPSGGVSVNQVTDVDATRLVEEVSTRVQAERQLIANQAVRVGPNVSAVLHDGGLDLRAAGVVALLAAAGPVQIFAIDTDPAEHAASRPARTMELRAGSAAALRRQLTALSAGYRVASVENGPSGSLRVTWPVDVDPVSPSR